MKTRLLTSAAGARNQKVIIERRSIHNDGTAPVTGGDEWWVMFNDGQVASFDLPDAALRAVRKAARQGNESLTVTTVEWRNVPDGWRPPTTPED